MTKIKIHNPVFGVPITIFSYQEGKEYKLIGVIKTYDFNDVGYLYTKKNKYHPFIGGKELYSRILIRRGGFS